MQVLLDCHQTLASRTKARIAIVDLKGLPTQQEFELFRDFFEYSGYSAVICSPDELEFDGEKLWYGGVAIDIVYKRLLVNEYLPIMDKAPALLDAYRAGAVCMVNSFRGKLVHKKAIFAVLTNERYASLFNEAELAAIADHIPWTRRFRNENTINAGTEIDLVEWTRSNASKLVLKPNADYGGHGTYIGWSLSAERMGSSHRRSENGDYLSGKVQTAKALSDAV